MKVGIADGPVQVRQRQEARYMDGPAIEMDVRGGPIIMVWVKLLLARQGNLYIDQVSRPHVLPCYARHPNHNFNQTKLVPMQSG